MKSFSQFQEDVNQLTQLRTDLDTLERQSAPAKRLAARRKAAAEQRKRQIEKEKEERERYQEQQRERANKQSGT